MWVKLADAAEYYDISETTLQFAIEHGSTKYRWRETPDGDYEIWIAEAALAMIGIG